MANSFPIFVLENAEDESRFDAGKILIQGVGKRPGAGDVVSAAE